MTTARWFNNATKKENLAIRLSGRIKNFTGKSPAIIKVKTNGCFVTIQLKWVVTDKEKNQFIRENGPKLKEKQKDFFEFIKNHLLAAVSGTFNSRETELYTIGGDPFQENLIIQVKLLDFAS